MYLFKTPDEMKHLIRHFYTSLSFDEARVKELGTYLADASNCICVLTSQSFKDEDLPEHEYWYKFNYSLEPFSAELLAKMKNPVVADNGKKLDLPPANDMLPTKFEVIPKDDALSEKPARLTNQGWDGIDAWYMKDDKFDKPKGIYSLKIYTGDVYFGSTPKARVFTTLWQACVQSLMQEFIYMAEMAAMKFELTVLRDNVSIKWDGFDDGLSQFVVKSLEVL